MDSLIVDPAPDPGLILSVLVNCHSSAKSWSDAGLANVAQQVK